VETRQPLGVWLSSHPQLAALFDRWTSSRPSVSVPAPAAAPTAPSPAVSDGPHDLAYYDAMATRVLTKPSSRAELATGLSGAFRGYQSLGVDVSTDRYLADYLARNQAALSAAHFELTPTLFNWFHGWGSGAENAPGGNLAAIKRYQAFDRTYASLPVQQQGMSPGLVHGITLGLAAIPVVGGIAATAVNVTEAAMTGGPAPAPAVPQGSQAPAQLPGQAGSQAAGIPTWFKVVAVLLIAGGVLYLVKG